LIELPPRERFEPAWMHSARPEYAIQAKRQLSKRELKRYGVANEVER
jgi:hypothetical protein